MRQKLRKSALYILAITTVCTLAFSGCSEEDHEHDYGNWKVKKEATCTEEGQKVRECDCGDEEVEVIASIGHAYEESAVTEAGCQGNGERTFTCANCNDSYTEEILPTIYTSTEIYDMNKNSVGEIVVYNKAGEEMALGTCFVYEAGNQMITNYHVIENSYAAKVTVDSKTYDVEKVLAYDKTIDVAILQLKNAELTPVTTCLKEHSVGKTVYALGNSKGLTATFSEGIITTADREYEGVHYVQHDAPISSGNSGGPLFNEYGEVIGINTWTVVDSQNLNFAIMFSELKNIAHTDPITMEEFYNTECAPFIKMKDYIIAEGTEDDDEYSMEFGKKYYASSVTYTCSADYVPEDDEIRLNIIAGDALMLMLFLDNELSGTYVWGYADLSEDYMAGTVKASTYTTNSALSYADTTISYSERSSILSVCNTLLDILCGELDSMFEDIGVTATDIGFKHF